MVPIKNTIAKPSVRFHLKRHLQCQKNNGYDNELVIGNLGHCSCGGIRSLFSEVPDEGNVDNETGLKMPELKHGKDYADPVTGAKVTAYYEDRDEE